MELTYQIMKERKSDIKYEMKCEIRYEIKCEIKCEINSGELTSKYQLDEISRRMFRLINKPA